ncbi:MAG: hypothetical protein HY738_08210 [Bacteroidia bacterium]|nr:hypothetical protein [Bacteroidia bacterium]
MVWHLGWRSICEDKSGNLWFGTSGGGVTCYNGEMFAHFTEKEGLSNNIVRSIYEDKSGNIWFGTYGSGITRYDGEFFTHFTENEGLSNNRVRSICEDKFGNIWFGTDGGGVTRYACSESRIMRDRTNGEMFAHFTEKEGLSNNTLWSICEDKSGNLWFGTWGGGVTRYDGEMFTHFTEKEGLSNSSVWSILEDKSGNLWFGTDGGGVTCYDPSATLRTGSKMFAHFTEKEGLSNNSIWSILEDKSGNLWFGTDGGGVTLYDGKMFTHFTQKEGLSSNSIRSILEDRSGNIWFGTNGGGVTRYDGKMFTHFTEKDGLSNNIVRSIYEDRNGNIWFGTAGGGITILSQQSAVGDAETRCTVSVQSAVSSQQSMKNRDVYKIYTLTEKQGLSNNNIYMIFEDKKGNLWVGTRDGGATVISRNKKLFYNLDIPIRHIMPLSYFVFSTNNTPRTMGEIQKGDKGVPQEVVKEQESGEAYIFHLTENEGLSSNRVYNFIEDRTGNIWMGTYNGLIKLTFSTLHLNASGQGNEVIKITNYGPSEGFTGYDVCLNAVCEDRSGNLWWGAGNLLTMYNPKYDITDTLAPQVHIKSVRLFFEEVEWRDLIVCRDARPCVSTNDSVSNVSSRNFGTKHLDIRFDGIAKWYPLPINLSLPYDQNHLTFNYIGINWKAQQKVKYRFMLKGMDKEWLPVTSRNEATYSNILPGEYTFMVKALSGDGYWSEPVIYSFTIRPPWWQTWWARITAAAAILILLFILYRWRIASMRQKQKELEQKVKERTADLRQA